MAKYVPDVNTKRWVIITPTRAQRPTDRKQKEKKTDPYSTVLKNGYAYHANCPFCFGNENLTPPELYRWGVSFPADQKWLVRVVPNKYPITDVHEVIIHSPDHLKDLFDFPLRQVEVLFKVYKERFNTLKSKGSVMIFNNKGPLSGESLVHPHSQVVVIPQQITLDALTLEPAGNIVEETGFFTAFCPDFSQWPYEVWIAKKECCSEGHKQNCLFGDINDTQINELSKLMQQIIQKLYKKFPNLSYNYYIYPHGCWYIRIIPRLFERAGFELGTGLSVNIVDPTEAARELRT